ncbi:MAG: hypothetical protein IJ091_05025 [Oscillospiraceae bacterium]|nr:hypothetical protein [Oscillospiraceae bacterium]
MSEKKIYLVKKDPELPESEENWIRMNSRQFNAFLRTPEGRARYQDFGILDSWSDEEPTVIIECGAKTALEWSQEAERHKYLERGRGSAERKERQCAKRIAVAEETEETLEETVPDLEQDTEEEAILRAEVSRVKKAMHRLKREEKEILYAFYLGDDIVYEQDYARKTGIPKERIRRLRRDALRHIQEILEEKQNASSLHIDPKHFLDRNI